MTKICIFLHFFALKKKIVTFFLITVWSWVFFIEARGPQELDLILSLGSYNVYFNTYDFFIVHPVILMQIYPTKDFLKKIRQTYIFFYLLLGIKIRFHGVRMIFLRTTSFEVFKIETGKNVEKLIF